MRMQCHVKKLVISVPHKKKVFATYRWHTHSRWQFTLISVVSSNETTYENVVSVLTEKYNIYKIHHYLSPKWCPHV
jgi:glyceraldehyde-3-phosphate dehydrogenase/erythrose-4-phosphate dehydrogenase